jgi:preprotein translocase subunit SecG
MKLQKANGNSRHSAQLNKVVFVVTLLWLAASLMLLLLYHSGPAHVVQPHPAAKEQLALLSPHATARASLMY